jgi:Prealbumin-like fold domain
VPAHAQVQKVTNPSGFEANWTFDLKDSSGKVLETETTTGAGATSFTTDLGEGSYQITETSKPDFDQTDASVDCSFTVNYPADSGRVFSCTVTNTQRGHIIVDKVTNPSGDPQSFDFTTTGAGYARFSLTDAASPNDSGGLVPGTYAVAETVPTGWDQDQIHTTCDGKHSDGTPNTPDSITLNPGQTVTCTFTNIKRGTAKVVKTVSGAVPSGTQSFTFQLRQGASTTSAGTVLETGTANAGNGGVIKFATNLDPSQTYQLCEIVMPGWSTNLGTVVSTTFSPPDDNSIVCGNFGQGTTVPVNPGQTLAFTVDNTPPPGGRALTIGFWKNWASCASSKGKQQPVLDQTLAKAEPTGIVVSAGSGSYPAFGPTVYLVLRGSTTNSNVAPSCAYAVNLLNKTRVDGTKKMASDPAFNLAAQLVAAELNYTAGAAQTPAATTAINQAVLLLGKYQFDGNTHTPISSADATTMNNLATTLDNYNNDR